MPTANPRAGAVRRGALRRAVSPALASTASASGSSSGVRAATSDDRCHVSHVVLDSGWEGKMAQTLEELDGVNLVVEVSGENRKDKAAK
jgi:hypothetical protein